MRYDASKALIDENRMFRGTHSVVAWQASRQTVAVGGSSRLFQRNVYRSVYAWRSVSLVIFCYLSTRCDDLYPALLQSEVSRAKVHDLAAGERLAGVVRRSGRQIFWPLRCRHYLGVILKQLVKEGSKGLRRTATQKRCVHSEKKNGSTSRMEGGCYAVICPITMEKTMD